MAQIGLPQALGLGPGIALFPANLTDSGGLVPSLGSSPSSPTHDDADPLACGHSGRGSSACPPRRDVCHRYGMEFMLLQRFYQNPDLWSRLKTKYEERRRRRLKKRRRERRVESEMTTSSLSWNGPSRKDGSSDENEDDDDSSSLDKTGTHGLVFLQSRAGNPQTVIQGPLARKIHSRHSDPRLLDSGSFDQPVVPKSQEETDLFHCLRDLDTTWSWVLWSSKDPWNPEFLSFLLEEIEIEATKKLRGRSENIISTYLNRHQFTELYLDGINNGFRGGAGNASNRHSATFDHHGNNNNNNNNNNGVGVHPRYPTSFLGGGGGQHGSGGVPPEIFRCSQVRILSLRSNHLDVLPADIGRMQKLEYLALTNNRLQNSSVPYTLSFCTKLKTLLLDDNLLDALPGFLLKMHSLETVHRHGNHNYFKATFMWYHTDVNERILPSFDDGLGNPLAASSSASSAASPSSTCGPTFSPEPLHFLAAKSLVGHKINFFLAEDLAPPMKDFVVELYERFDLEVCENCCVAKVSPYTGFKVITFKNPYLGNTCVPFQHWACSMSCARAIEEPARLEQVSAAARLDRLYDHEVRLAQDEFLRRYRRHRGEARIRWRRGRREDDDRGDAVESEYGADFSGAQKACCQIM